MKNINVIKYSIIFDNGLKFAKHEQITKKLGIKTYFAHPYSSWQRGANKNTSGLIRQFFRKSIRLDNLSDNLVQAVQDNLNNRPRKILGYRTQLEVKSNPHRVALRL